MNKKKIKKQSPSEILNELITIFKSLNHKFPNQGLGRHIADATVEYPNLWSLPNSELLFALNKYQTELDLNIVDQSEVDKIIKDAENIEHILDSDEDMFDVDDNKSWM